MTLPTRLLLCAALATSISVPARSEVIHGFQQLRPSYVEGWPTAFSTEGFDFSAQAIVHFLSDAADLSYQERLKYSGEWDFHTPGGIMRSALPLEDIEQAPLEGYKYGYPDGSATVGQSYVIRTRDAMYAKFRVLGFDPDGYCCSLTIEYYLQTDGSPTFGPTLPVRSTTWGRVKSLYR